MVVVGGVMGGGGGGLGIEMASVREVAVQILSMFSALNHLA